MAEIATDQRRRARRSLLPRLVRIVAAALIVVILLPLVLVPVYAVVPPVSTLMLARWATGRPVERSWLPLASMGRYLPRAVVAAEDAQFCRHAGVDWDALAGVVESAGGPSRGASTIPMQTAKNLFLWPGGGYVRKPIEIVLALYMDLVWSKRRMLEIYLNVAEWGPDGIFGAASGANRAFRRPPAALGPRQATLMAAALPNPIERNPARPTRALVGYANAIERRAHTMPGYFDCLDR